MSNARIIRQQPFCWQEKYILRKIRENYKGQDRVKLLLLYQTLTWIQSDFNCEEIKYYTKVIHSYSGLSIKYIPKGLRELERLGFIKIIKKFKNKQFKGTAIVFCNNLDEKKEDFDQKNSDLEEKLGQKDFSADSPIGNNSRYPYRQKQPIPLSAETADHIEHSNNIIEHNNNIIEHNNFNNNINNIYNIKNENFSKKDDFDKKNSDLSKKKEDFDQKTKNYKENSTIGKQINEIIHIFEKINPTINYANKTFRKSAEDLIKKFGFENIKKLAELAIEIHGQEFAPRIGNPYELSYKLDKLKAYIENNGYQKNKINIISI